MGFAPYVGVELKHSIGGDREITVTPVDRMLHSTFNLETYRLIYLIVVYLTSLSVTLASFHTLSATRLHSVER